MATVDKNFRIKNGLVVEGSTATVNGNNILTENIADQYILNLIGGETLVKSVDPIFAVDSAGNLTLNYSRDNIPGTIMYRDGFGNLAAGQIDLDSKVTAPDYRVGNAGKLYDNDGVLELAGYNSNNVRIYAPNNVYVDAGNGDVILQPDGVAKIWNDTIATQPYAEYVAGNAQTAAQGYADSLASNYDAAGSASAAQTAAQNYADGLAVNYDPAGAANTAQTNAQNYTDTALNSYTPTSSLDATVSGYGYLKSADLNGYATEAYVDQAETDANTYTDNAISNLGGSGTASVAGHIDILTGTGIDVNPGNNSIEIARQTVDTWYDAAGSAATAEQNANIYTDNAVSALVDSAPAMLDTLNELAAAIADNPNYATDVANLVATKADTTYVDSEISGVDSAAQGYATTAENNAKSYADSLASNYDAAGAASTAETNANSYTDGQITNLTDGTNSFQNLNIEDVVAQRAAGNTALPAMLNVVFEWAAADYRSAKILVKAAYGAHTQISELMVTLDTSNNVAVSEYGITYSNGTELAAITADYLNGNVRVLATPASANTDVTVFATLLI